MYSCPHLMRWDAMVKFGQSFWRIEFMRILDSTEPNGTEPNGTEPTRTAMVRWVVSSKRIELLNLSGIHRQRFICYWNHISAHKRFHPRGRGQHVFEYILAYLQTIKIYHLAKCERQRCGILRWNHNNPFG